MKEFLVHNKNQDDFDNFVHSSNYNFGYLDKTIDFPEVDNAKAGQGIEAEWFYEVLAGTPGFSELNAIRLYRSDNTKYDSIATLMAGISMVEMQHYDHLQEFILQIGGNIDGIEYDNSELRSATEGSTDVKIALAISIESEKETIREYERIMELCKAAEDSPTKEIALQLLNKLIADEKSHIGFFQEKLNSLNQKIGFGL